MHASAAERRLTDTVAVAPVDGDFSTAECMSAAMETTTGTAAAACSLASSAGYHQSSICEFAPEGAPSTTSAAIMAKDEAALEANGERRAMESYEELNPIT